MLEPSAGGRQQGVASSFCEMTAPMDSKNGQQQNGQTLWKRRDTEYASTEGSLRSLLNKLAPSETLNSIAGQVANHLLEDEAPEELARQLVIRVQGEPLYADTYAKLCTILVRIRSGFVFYRQLLTRCRETFSQSLRLLILGPEAGPSSSHSLPYKSNNVEQRHRLRALVVFMCHLFLEGLLPIEIMNEEFLQKLACHLPDEVASECLCKALSVSGRLLTDEMLEGFMKKLQETLQVMRYERNLRLIFMIEDLLDLQLRNWQPRVQHGYQSSPVDDRAEP